MIMEFAVEKAKENCMIRLIIGPSPRTISLPADYQLTPGQGVALTEGADAVLFAYGPVMIHEALTAAEMLADKGRLVRVINMPWLNRIDPIWLAKQLKNVAQVLVVEDHAPYGALADNLLSTMIKADIPIPPRFEVAGVEGYPACGTPSEALRFHKLDGVSLANRIGSLK